jgi:hypothetical protein
MAKSKREFTRLHLEQEGAKITITLPPLSSFKRLIVIHEPAEDSGLRALAELGEPPVPRTSLAQLQDRPSSRTIGQKKADQALLNLSRSLNQGQSETLRTFLKTMAKFHRYSWFNCMLIWMQRPEATHVAGFKKWLELGRCVKKGEKGIMILAPVIYRPRKPKIEEPKEKEESRIVGMLHPGAGVVTTRGHVQYVVTEYGIANLYAKNLRQRAEALIAIAHPEHRETLERAAYERFESRVL